MCTCKYNTLFKKVLTEASVVVVVVVVVDEVIFKEDVSVVDVDDDEDEVDVKDEGITSGVKNDLETFVYIFWSPLLLLLIIEMYCIGIKCIITYTHLGKSSHTSLWSSTDISLNLISFLILSHSFPYISTVYPSSCMISSSQFLSVHSAM